MRLRGVGYLSVKSLRVGPVYNRLAHYSEAVSVSACLVQIFAEGLCPREWGGEGGARKGEAKDCGRSGGPVPLRGWGKEAEMWEER